MPVSPYRPRNPGHDYYCRGVYLVTLVVSGRQPLLSTFAAEICSFEGEASILRD